MESDLKARVLASLPRGKQNAITGEWLAVKMGSNKPRGENRVIRLAIQELIADGYPICSSPGRKADKKTNTPKQEAGYFMADNPSEVRESLVVLRSYGKQIFRHYYALKKAGQKEFSGQLTLRL